MSRSRRSHTETANNVHRQATDLSMNRVGHRRNGQTVSKEVTTGTAGPSGEGARKDQKQKEKEEASRGKGRRGTLEGGAGSEEEEKHLKGQPKHHETRRQRKK